LTPAGGRGGLVELAREVNRIKGQGGDAATVAAELKTLAGMLGLLQRDPEAFLKGGVGSSDGPDDAAIDAMVAARVEAKANKEWAEADRIRDELKALGIVLEDSAEGTSWRRE